MRYVYPVIVEADEDGRLLATAPDVPEAVADGASVAEALRAMSEMLGVALAGYVREGRALPEPSAPSTAPYQAPVAPLVAAKLALRSAMAEQGVSHKTLAGRLGLTEAALRRLMDPDHGSSLEAVLEALATLGYGLILEDIRPDAA